MTYDSEAEIRGLMDALAAAEERAVTAERQRDEWKKWWDYVGERATVAEAEVAALRTALQRLLRIAEQAAEESPRVVWADVVEDLCRAALAASVAPPEYEQVGWCLPFNPEDAEGTFGYFLEHTSSPPTRDDWQPVFRRVAPQEGTPITDAFHHGWVSGEGTRPHWWPSEEGDWSVLGEGTDPPEPLDDGFWKAEHDSQVDKVIEVHARVEAQARLILWLWEERHDPERNDRAGVHTTRMPTGMSDVLTASLRLARVNRRAGASSSPSAEWGQRESALIDEYKTAEENE